MTKGSEQERINQMLAAIKDYWDKNGNSPTLRDISKMTGIKSTGMVSFYLGKLVEAGKITRSGNKSRSIFLTHPVISKLPLEPGRRILSIPDFGPIAAGIPLHLPDASFQSVDNPDKDPHAVTVDIPESYLPAGVSIKDVFALHVQGNSMRDAMLTDGDIIIIQRTANIKNRDIVAAWIIDDHETTLKRVEITERGVWLRPENLAFEPRFYLPDQVQIQGKLLAVLRFIY